MIAIAKRIIELFERGAAAQPLPAFWAF